MRAEIPAKSAAQGAKKRIGELLVEADVISRQQLGEALATQKKEGGKLVEILINLGHLDTGKVAQFLAAQRGIPSIEIANYRVEPEVLALIPRAFALQHEVFPLDKLGKLLTVGMAFPLDSVTINKLEEMTGLSVKALLCHSDDIRKAIAYYYQQSGGGLSGQSHEVHAARISASARVDSVAHLVREIDNLPTLPKTVRRVQELAASAETPLKEIAAVIAKDPAISAKLLRLANSPAFGFTRKVDNVELATSLLGLRETVFAITSSAVLDLTERANNFDHTAFWKYSMVCANVAKQIGNACGLKQCPAVFTAGLLCDIGRFALAECAPARYGRIERGLADQLLLEAEEKVLGIGHPEAGYILAEHWQLPVEIAEAVRYHVAPEHAQSHAELTAVVSLAARLTDAHFQSLQDELEILSGCGTALTRLGFPADTLMKMYRDWSKKPA